MKIIAATALLGVVLGVLFVAYPGIDLYVSSLFYSDAGGFIFRGRPAALFLNDMTHVIGTVLPALLGVGFVLTVLLRRPILRLRARHYVFLILCLGLGPVLTANYVFKEHWGRARPKHVVEFGGTREFSPAFVISHQCAHNCSFISGDASLGFVVTAFALLARRRRRLWVTAAIGVGTLTGLSRMTQGAHFLSDIVFAGIFTIFVVLVLKWLIVDEGWRPLLARAGPGETTAVSSRGGDPPPPARPAGLGTGSGTAEVAPEPPDRPAIEGKSPRSPSP